VWARDTVTSAPELARMTLNMASVHSDSAASHLSGRLVYGGHVFSMAFAQVTRALPNLLAILAWETCDHVAPVLENDVLRTEVEVCERTELSSGTLLKLRVESFAIRMPKEDEICVLDWTFFAWSL
jgi:acyl dehydratase